MTKTSRKPKITEASCSNEEDLISRLPDEILTHILSYIDTRSTIATTILSKRWNGLWISVPNLDFGLYRSRGNSGYTVTEAQFANFIDRVLSLNNVISVRNIFLEFWGYAKVDRLNSWLVSIAKRDVEKILSLGFDPDHAYCLPDSFFNQKNLVELQFQYFVSEIPESVCFPSLRIIRLEDYELNDCDSLKNLIFGCQVLTDLFILISGCDDAYTLNICSSTLRVLELRILETYFSPNVVIDAPNLRHFTLEDNKGASFDIRNVTSLVNANLTFEDESEELLEFLTKISHVNELFLSIYNGLDLTDYLADMPMFHNLIKLTLKIPAFDHWLCSFRIFHCTPNLVTCVILLNNHCYTHRLWDEPIKVPHCFSSCLESIKVPVFLEGGPQEDEMQMISYILKNAIVLKTLYLEGRNRANLEQENVFLKKLLTLHKSSAACQVSYEVISSS